MTNTCTKSAAYPRRFGGGDGLAPASSSIGVLVVGLCDGTNFWPKRWQGMSSHGRASWGQPASVPWWSICAVSFAFLSSPGVCGGDWPGPCPSQCPPLHRHLQKRWSPDNGG